MGSSSRFSYQRLQQELGWFDHEEDQFINDQIGKLRLSSNFRLTRRVHVRRRLKVRIPSLRRFLRRKARLVTVACKKIVKRLKESQSHFGDLFAGNYLFLQVAPTPLKNKQLKPPGSSDFCLKKPHDQFPSSSLYSASKMA
ncbi:OLC1v1016460C1 [Oldenlandia corymbosa var. corymbosa]|uniref:OLC1v1016460C1 n=1 Tax=Oldenlandia corymbosa var. corymbosa TaxID=529605 RepID=A0AAV1E5T5_OLDCO|nr:OLC1v1016460C1 [Oldenlandia corymbosa var. corymbosa]